MALKNTEWKIKVSFKGLNTGRFHLCNIFEMTNFFLIDERFLLPGIRDEMQIRHRRELGCSNKVQHKRSLEFPLWRGG